MLICERVKSPFGVLLVTETRQSVASCFKAFESVSILVENELDRNRPR